MRTPYTRGIPAFEGRPPLRNHFATAPYPTWLGPGRTLASNPDGGEKSMPKYRSFLRRSALVSAVAVLAFTAAATAGAAQSRKSGTTISGAGSTFVQPLVSQWVTPIGAAYGYELQYSGIGSGGGVAAVTARTVDFGASDAPLTADQFNACNGCVQIPWALSATAIIYNLPGVKNLIKMDEPTLAKTFMGQITSWNDPAIQKLNKGVNLPST